MNAIREKMKKIKCKNIGIIISINIIIFALVNLLFDIKYEQVDDFIIYNLYSGLDGTYNMHGIYIHPIICFAISSFFRIIPAINWHTIFLLSMQFICFTIIGAILIKKHKNVISIVLYTIFASVFYTSLLLLIQYTSVSALLILTSFFMMIDRIEEEKEGIKNKIASGILFGIGIMTRMQSLLIIAPFFLLYGIFYFIKWRKKEIETKKLISIIKEYLVFAIITVIIYVSSILIYQTNDLYREYMEYNDIRATLHDMSYTDYDENKEISDEIGWSKNDHYLFYTFNFGDETVYSKEKLQKIIDYKISKNEYYNLNLNCKLIIEQLVNEMTYTNTYISIILIAMFIVATSTNKKNTKLSIGIFVTTLATHLLFIILNRSMLRVVMPEYVLGTVLLLYYTKWEENQSKKYINPTIWILTICVVAIFSGSIYNFNYQIEDYRQYKDVINYTNEHKENVYLYTVPSLQYRYLTYSVYEMPPKGAFSNLRVMGRMGYVYW